MIWLERLKYDPIAPLVESNNPFIKYFTQKEILNRQVPHIISIWELKEPQKILQKQLSNGSWKSNNRNKEKYPIINYDLIETWKKFRFLIEMYQLDRSKPEIVDAAEYIFSCQSDEGDIRGILANQYAMYYTGAILYLLIKAGYVEDQRVHKGLNWLLSRRQHDGGWVATPFQTLNLSGNTIKDLTTVEPSPLKEHDTSKPSSYHWTGMVLRAFAIHPEYRARNEIHTAANILKSGFFKADRYSSYHHPDNWVRFQFPFWWNNLVSALDSLSYMDIAWDDEHINLALQWLIDHQLPNGLWKHSYSSIHGSKPNEEAQFWISLAICRILKRFFEHN